MKRIFFLSLGICLYVTAMAANWSFSGGFVYFDNSQTRWTQNLYLIIGKSSYSSVYPMTLDREDTTRYVASLPLSGWSDAEYMAVISNSDWKKGNWGYSELKNAAGYTAAYTAGLGASANQRYLLTPAGKGNGTSIELKHLGDNQPISFADGEKNNCQKLDADKGVVTVIFSTSAKRHNVNPDEIDRVYMKGSVSIWAETDPHYVLPVRSSDGCFFGTFRLSDLQRRGNSGQPEFVFRVVKKDGYAYDCRAHSSWREGPIDERLVFINNGENMLLLLPGDDIVEIGQRKQFAQYIAPLKEFDLTDSAGIAHLTNFRRVPATRHLYRSYHPYKGDRPQLETEAERLRQLAILGEKYGIQCDIALSGKATGTFTIPTYYQSIIANDNVLYVGTANGHTPDYNTAVFRTDEELFGQWMQEVVRFIIDDKHPAPFQIHCSLGADRTGAFCATLAALCGASWEEIAADYHQTSNLRIQEYRHPNCVRYELYLLTGEWPEVFAPVSAATGRTLKQAVAEHFIEGGYLTQAEIDAAVAKLTASKTPTSLSASVSNNSSRPVKLLHDAHLCVSFPNALYTSLGQRLR